MYCYEMGSLKVSEGYRMNEVLSDTMASGHI